MPESERTALREAKVPAAKVIALFHFHHIAFHVFDGSDRWHNLHPMLGEDHRARTPGDITTIAKVRRSAEKWRAFMRRISKPRRARKKSRWPSRPFAKRVKK